MDPTQFYETTIYNRDSDQALVFATVPARSLPDAAVPTAGVLAERFGLEGGRLEPLEAWSLPLVIDAYLGRFPDVEYFGREPWPFLLRSGGRPSQFAQYVTYAPVVPWESSPLTSKSLADVVVSAGGAASAYVTHDPLLLLTMPVGIILCRAAVHVGDGIGIALRTLILRLVDAEDQAPPPE